MTSNSLTPPRPGPACDPQLWPLNPQVTFLNHGSFGSCPQAVLAVQDEWRARLERQPVQFFVRELEGLLDQARGELARFVGAETDDLVFVPNATAGVNTVLRSLAFQPNDELLVTDHEYNACRNALNHVAERTAAIIIEVPVPFPLTDPGQVLDAVIAHVTSRTRLVLLDHITSQTGLVLPIAELVGQLAERGVDCLIDGAHAPGMVPLKLNQLNAAYYTGNCHKWLCAPKGAGFLHVRRDHQTRVRPLSISHGANSPRTDRSRFLVEFGWTGTDDPSAWLCVPEAIRFVGSLLPGGWPEVMQRNHDLALAGREVLCQALHCQPPCPAAFLGSLASVPIPDATNPGPVTSPLYLDPLQDELLERLHFEVPVIPWPAPPKRLLRISAQLYNSLGQYQRLANALHQILPPSPQP